MYKDLLRIEEERKKLLAEQATRVPVDYKSLTSLVH